MVGGTEILKTYWIIVQRTTKFVANSIIIEDCSHQIMLFEIVCCFIILGR